MLSTNNATCIYVFKAQYLVLHNQTKRFDSLSYTYRHLIFAKPEIHTEKMTASLENCASQTIWLHIDKCKLIYSYHSTQTKSQVQVQRISSVCVNVAPVNNKSDGLWIKQAIRDGDEISGRQKEFWDSVRDRRITWGICEETYTWYLSIHTMPNGKMQVKVNGL